MNMPVDVEGKVHFTSTLFALVRVNLNIFIRYVIKYVVIILILALHDSGIFITLYDLSSLIDLWTKWTKLIR